VSSALILLAVPLALVGLHIRGRMTVWQRRIWIGALVVAVLLAAAQLGAIALHNIATVPEWDFLGFWLNAHIAAAHHNIYDPSYARAAVGSFPISDEFRREIIDVGFWYPPPSIFIFLPLAAFSNVHVAYACWYLIQGAAFVAAVIVLARTFLRTAGAEGVLVVAVLTLALPAAAETVLYGQTNFLLLLAIALFWGTKDRLPSGIWLAVAILIKPFAAALGLALLLRRKVAPLGVAAGAIFAATAAAVVLLGVGTLRAYLSAGPVPKLPAWVYMESTNQSLLGVILRAMHAAPTAALHLPIAFVAVAAILVAATTWLCLNSERDTDDLALALCLMVALLIYPTSQTFYALVLVVPLLVLWQQREALPYKTTAIVGFITLLYVIMRLRHETLAPAYLLIWFALAAAALRGSAAAGIFHSVKARLGTTGTYAALFAVSALLLIGRDVARPNAPFLAPIGLDFRAFYCSGYAIDRGADPYRVEPLRSCEHRFQPAAGWSDALVVPSPLPGYDLAVLGALARLPYAAAKDVWYLLTLAAFLVTIAMMRRVSGLPVSIVFLAFVFVDWWESYHFGQLPILATAALCCAAAFATSRHYTAASIAAAAAMLEPHLGLPACLAMFAWLPQTRVPLAICALVMAGLSVAAVGPSLSVTYFTQILPMHAASELAATDQFSLSHLAHLAGVTDSGALALGSLCYLVMTAIGVFLARRTANTTRTIAFIVLLPPAVGLLGGPFLHALQFAAAIPAMLMLAAKAQRWRPLAWMTLTLIALPWFSLSPNATFHDRSTLQVLLEQVLALTAVVTFALTATRGMPLGARRWATAAPFLVIFVALIGAAHLKQAPFNRPESGLPAAVLEPSAEASENWGAYIRSSVQSAPSPQMELKKIPYWIAILGLILVTVRQARVAQVDLPQRETRIAKHEPLTKTGLV
jgi:hypothetical protein